MIEQQGRVVRVVNGKARVRLGGTSGCSACDEGKGCGAGVFGRLLRRKPVELVFQNTVHAVEGQAVVVGLPESLFLSLVFRLYLLPLLAALAGAALGHWLASAQGLAGVAVDLAALSGAVVFSVLSFAVSRRARTELFDRVAVHLLRIVENEVAT